MQPHGAARNHRTEPSSSSSSQAGPFLVSSVRYRVAAPPARPLPNESCWNKDCSLIHRSLGLTLEDGVAKILINNGIEAADTPELVYRCIPGDDGSGGQPTVTAVATWDDITSPPVWERAVKEAKRFVDATVLASPELRHLDVGVEMIAEELTPSNYVACILNEELTESLVRETGMPSEATSAESWSLFRKHKEKPPASPSSSSGAGKTLAATLSRSTSRPITSLKRLGGPLSSAKSSAVSTHMGITSVSTLSTAAPELYVSSPLLSSAKTPEQNPTKPLRRLPFLCDAGRVYRTKVGLGEDIGVAGYIDQAEEEKVMPGIGTLGCWVEMKTTGTQEWAKYALTNYHLVRPALEGFRLTDESTPAAPKVPSDLQTADLDGIAPNNTNIKYPVMKMEHPTRMKHCFAVGFWQRIIFKNPPSAERTEKEEFLANIKAYFDDGKQIFGTIHAASGFGRRSPTNGRMDWALIKPLDASRVGKNTLPSFEEWLQNGVCDLPLLVAMGKSLKQPPAHGLCRSTKNGEFLYKKGSSTGPTVGVFSVVKSEVAMTDDAHLGNVANYTRLSQEFVYIGEPTADDLAHNVHGDSGSVVFNEEGRAVGLLLRGQKAHSTINRWAYVTPMEDIFADIKEFFQGQATDIRIAEDSEEDGEEDGEEGHGERHVEDSEKDSGEDSEEYSEEDHKGDHEKDTRKTARIMETKMMARERG